MSILDKKLLDLHQSFSVGAIGQNVFLLMLHDLFSFERCVPFETDDNFVS